MLNQAFGSDNGQGVLEAVDIGQAQGIDLTATMVGRTVKRLLNALSIPGFSGSAVSGSGLKSCGERQAGDRRCACGPCTCSPEPRERRWLEYWSYE